MFIINDYHTHTIYSHGKGTVEDNVKAAIARGLKRIAITDHGPGSVFFKMRPGGMLAQRREIDALNQKYSGQIEILMGLELNITGDGVCDLRNDEKSLLDIMLLGFHRGVVPTDALMRRVALIPWMQREKLAKRMADAIVSILGRYPISIVTHPGEYICVDIDTLSRGAAELGVALEVNNRHPSLSIGDARLAKANGAAFVINSDAHIAADVGEFSSAIDFSLKAGIENRIINSSEGSLDGLRLAYVHPR